MSKRPVTTKDTRVRLLVTQEAARIMAEEGIKTEESRGPETL